MEEGIRDEGQKWRWSPEIRSGKMHFGTVAGPFWNAPDHQGRKRAIRNGRMKWEMVGPKREWSGCKEMDAWQTESRPFRFRVNVESPKMHGRIIWGCNTRDYEGVGGLRMSRAWQGWLVLRGAMEGRAQAMRGSFTP